MTSASSELAAWSFGLAGLIFSAFAIRLWALGYARAPRSATSTSLVAAATCSALWAGFGLADFYSTDLVFRGLATVADIARYACWNVCLLSFLGPDRETRLGGRWLVSMSAVLIAAALLTQWPAALQRVFAPESPLVLLSALSLPVFALVLVEQLYRNVHEDSRWNAKPLCLGLTGTFIFDLYLYSRALLVGHVDEQALQVRGLVHALMVPLLFLSIRRRRDWISKLRLSRRAAFHSATLLIAGLYLLFVSAVGYYVRYFGGEWGQALQLAVVFAALVALSVVGFSGSVRAKLKVQLGKHFFQYRYDYREEWLRFTQLLSGSAEPQHTAETVVRALANLVESPSGMLWMQRSAGGDFMQAARWNLPALPVSEARDGVLATFWRERAWIIDVQEWRERRDAYPGLELPAWLVDEPRCWLIVPLLVREALTGFVVLGRPRAVFELNWEVRDLLRMAASQASGYLDQAQATEALLEARKFDAFNRMSAFVVHDLKNIVTQLSLMMKNAKRLRDNPEFQQDMLDTVENSLEKMRQLMLQLREGDKPHGVTSGVDLEQIAKGLAAAAASKGRVLELELQPGVSTRGHAERVERVLGHVVQNAFDATPPGGRVCLTLDAEGSQARVRVEDSGCGMSEDFIQNRLFKPFQTTKASGMGIGAHESYQYVQELGGKISVQSELNRGTTVTLLLPLFHAQVDAPLAVLDTR